MQYISKRDPPIEAMQFTETILYDESILLSFVHFSDSKIDLRELITYLEFHLNMKLKNYRIEGDIITDSIGRLNIYRYSIKMTPIIFFKPIP